MIRTEPGMDAGALLSPGEEVGLKLNAVRSWLDREQLSAVLLGSQASFAWITAGGRSHVSIGEAAGVASALVTPDAAHSLTPNNELRRILDEEIAGLPFDALEVPWHAPGEAVAILRGLCDTRRAVSDIGMHGLPFAGPGLAELRYSLLPPEIERFRLLGLDAAEVVEEACREAEPGDTELEVAARVADGCVRRDILPLVDLVAADQRIARYRHPIPTENRVRRTMLVALTGRRQGLHASLTRMVSFGQPDQELADRYEAVTGVDARVILESGPGVPLGEAMAGLIDQYAIEGFPDEWRLHHQGGLTGYAGREIFATPGAPHVLAPNQALAWNPSITRVKSEDTILLGERSFEVLTRTGVWPESDVQLHAGTVARPDLLVA